MAAVAALGALAPQARRLLPRGPQQRRRLVVARVVQLLAVAAVLYRIATRGANAFALASPARRQGPVHAPAPRVALGAAGPDQGQAPNAWFNFGGASNSVVLLNFVTLLFGSNQVMIKILETDDATADAMPCALCLTLRFGIAFVALGGAILVRNALAASRKAGAGAQEAAAEAAALQHAGAGANEGPCILAGAAELSIWLFIGFLAQAAGLQYTTAQAGALLGSLTVVVVPLLSLTDGRRIGQSTWVSVALAFLGTLLFVGPEALTGAVGGLGDGLELLSAVLFAVQLWRCEKIARNLPEAQMLDLTCLQLGFVTLMSFTVLALEGHSLGGLAETMAGWPLAEWGEVGVMGLVTTAFCLWAEAQALREVDAAPAALIYACEPVWGAFFAWLWLGETLNGPMAISGGLLLLLASAVGATASGEQASEPQRQAAGPLVVSTEP